MRVTKSEYAEQLAHLRDWLKPGDTVYTVLDHVSRSGMMRHIRVLVPTIEQTPCDCHTFPESAPHFIGAPRLGFVHPNYATSIVTGTPMTGRRDALKVSGCGMDMGFALVYELSHKVYPDYACLGKGSCPSPYHTNHRDRVRCDGVHFDDPESRRFCYAPDPFGRWEVPNDWPRSEPQTIETEDGPVQIPGRYLACLSGSGEDGKPYEVCPTCEGLGSLPNPSGPERFDLVHTDGYALRHKWL